ncbi:MAG: prepilin peptidase [Proteobacteria bacterium]|nr:prepilin peptidase [Pseudomonadota bacterium]
MPVLMMSAGGLVALAAAWDVFSRRIPNLLPLIIAALYFAQAIYAQTWSDIPWHLLTGVGVLVVGIVIFALKLIGGGDVKLLAALALWAGPDHIILLLLVTCLAGGILGIVFVLPGLLGRNPGFSRAVDWIFEKIFRREGPMLIASSSKGIQLPYGVAIAVAGFVVFYKIGGGSF